MIGSSHRQWGSSMGPERPDCDISYEPEPDITYMVASHLQGDIVSGEEGGCGLISGLDRGTCPSAPIDFAAKVLI